MRKCQNIAIESRFADGKWDRLPGLAAELTRVQVDVIVTYTTPALRIRRQRHRPPSTQPEQPAGCYCRLYVRLSLSDGDARQKRKPTYYESQP
jgi:hypothetical protein